MKMRRLDLSNSKMTKLHHKSLIKDVLVIVPLCVSSKMHVKSHIDCKNDTLNLLIARYHGLLHVSKPNVIAASGVNIDLSAAEEKFQ